MVICIGVGLSLLGPWLPCPGLWAVLGLFFSCARDVSSLFGFVCFPRAVGFFLGCFVGCARTWVLGFVFSGLIGCLCWLCPYVGDWFLFIRCFFVSG